METILRLKQAAPRYNATKIYSTRLTHDPETDVPADDFADLDPCYVSVVHLSIGAYLNICTIHFVELLRCISKDPNHILRGPRMFVMKFKIWIS